MFNKTNKDMTTLEIPKLAQDFFNKRTDLVNNEKFIQWCIGFAKENGITAKEWNDNTFAILSLLANEFCAITEELNER